MLEDISLLGKEQSGRLKYHPSKVNIIPFCSKVIQESKEVIKNDVNVRFVNNLKESTVILDKNLLRQILNNVITNAMKYSQSRKEVIFEITQEENEFVKFIVTDNGIGIPKDDLKNIFEPFQRASNVEKYKGSGLGLSIVKKFVDLHNGTIQIKSELKKGTIVTIKIPLVVQEN
jgi:signal transduction histidine kinase